MGNKLNICIFVPWITSGRGGTEHIGSLMANLMAEYGHEVSVHTFDDEKKETLWPLSPRVPLYHHSENETPATETRITEILANLGADVIVGLHTTREFSRYINYAKALGVPVILSEHIDPSVPQKLGLNTKKERLNTFGKADKIHLVNADFLATLPLALRQKSIVIPNTIAEPGTGNPKNTSSNKHPTILTVARLTPVKNTINLLRAFVAVHSRYPDWRLVVAGYGEMLAPLKREAEQRAITEKVTFLGRVMETRELYENADIFALPSLHEGFPLSSLEAMSHGLPLLGYKRCPGLNQQIETGKNGYLCWGGKWLGSLPGKLSKLMADSELRTRMGIASFEKFQREYAPEKIGRRWEKMIEDVCLAHNSS